MSQVDRVEMHFSGGDEAPELDNYRPISPLVIVAWIAGLVSLLAVVHPVLWMVPAVAAILSVCAIRQVSAPQSRYSGRLAAVAALCLALLIGTYAPARALSLERALYRRAQAQAEAWISLVQQGRYQEAHQFSLGQYERFAGPGPLSEHYLSPTLTTPGNETTQAPQSMDDAAMMLDPSGSDQLADFLQNPVVVKLVEYGEQASIAHIQNVSIATRHGDLEVTQRFRVSGVLDGQPGSFEFFLTSTRWKALGHGNWQVSNFKAAAE